MIRAQGLASYKLRGIQWRMGRFYPLPAVHRDWFTIAPMNWPKQPWIVELLAAGAALAIGVALMPILIFYIGVASLGRYEGASLGALYGSVFNGLKEPSLAAWLVILGPYALYLLFRGLKAWWRASAQLA